MHLFRVAYMANAGAGIDSWAFHFCNRPGKETLGCGLFHFFAALGLWDEERYQPRPGDLAQNGIEVRDFAVTNAMRR